MGACGCVLQFAMYTQIGASNLGQVMSQEAHSSSSAHRLQQLFLPYKILGIFRIIEVFINWVQKNKAMNISYYEAWDAISTESHSKLSEIIH